LAGAKAEDLQRLRLDPVARQLAIGQSALEGLQGLSVPSDPVRERVLGGLEPQAKELVQGLKAQVPLATRPIETRREFRQTAPPALQSLIQQQQILGGTPLKDFGLTTAPTALQEAQTNLATKRAAQIGEPKELGPKAKTLRDVKAFHAQRKIHPLFNSLREQRDFIIRGGGAPPVTSISDLGKRTQELSALRVHRQELKADPNADPRELREVEEAIRVYKDVLASKKRLPSSLGPVVERIARRTPTLDDPSKNYTEFADVENIFMQQSIIKEAEKIIETGKLRQGLGVEESADIVEAKARRLAKVKSQKRGSGLGMVNPQTMEFAPAHFSEEQAFNAGFSAPTSEKLRKAIADLGPMETVFKELQAGADTLIKTKGLGAAVGLAASQVPGAQILGPEATKLGARVGSAYESTQKRFAIFFDSIKGGVRAAASLPFAKFSAKFLTPGKFEHESVIRIKMRALDIVMLAIRDAIEREVSGRPVDPRIDAEIIKLTAAFERLRTGEIDPTLPFDINALPIGGGPPRLGGPTSQGGGPKTAAELIKKRQRERRQGLGG